MVTRQNTTPAILIPISAPIKRGSIRWVLCRCECGNEKEIREADLLRKDGRQIRHCGRKCPAVPKGKPPIRVVHGMARKGTRNYIYSAWEHIKSRCFNPKDSYYHAYGGRGITLYSGWVNDFSAFHSYVAENLGKRPDGWSLDRINNDGSYDPGNIRWAAPLTQSRNTRRNRRLTVGDETLTISEWAERYGVSGMTIHCRLKRGWSAPGAVSAPAGAPRC